MKRQFGIPKHVEMAVGMLRGGSEVVRKRRLALASQQKENKAKGHFHRDWMLSRL